MKIQIYHATAGHGHKKVADVIGQTFNRRGVNDVQVIDVLDLTPPAVKSIYPAAYYYSVKWLPKIWGWFYETLDSFKIYRILYPIRHLHNKIAGTKVLEKVKREKPEILISSHFLTAELFASAKKRGEIEAVLFTVITDFLPHTFWVNDGTDYYWVMGEEGKQSLLKRGVPESQICVGGIPIDDKFKPNGRRKEILKNWQFDENRFTLLFTSGSFGLGQQEAILKELTAFQDKIQCFVVCGNNKTLYRTLSVQKWPFPIQIFNFIDFMPDLMEASDLILAKSGGATTTESLAKGIPMVILDPIPGQESRNAELLLERNASFTLQRPAQIKTILQSIFEYPQLLQDKRLEMRKIAKPNAADDLVTFVLEKVSKRI